ncbi:uncharacterized protein [Rutidosis leptorrhynchoides]|uniref:uncharacterized protein n=1 Tax=Rutidosis leptorrhynchoides TaxID=125765 RepID=UPI003A9A4729
MCIAVFQENKCKILSDSWVQSLWGDANYGYVQKEVVGKSGGLLVIWGTSKFAIIDATSGDFYLAIKGKWKKSGEESIIVNVYGPHNDRSKKLMWDSLNNLVNSVDSAYLLCDDFKEMRDPSDRLNSQFHQSLWDDLSTIALDRNLLDHCRLVLMDKVIDYGSNPFKVFDEWFNCVDIDRVILEAWEQPIWGSRLDCNFRDRLKNVTLALKSWSKSNFGSLDSEIKDLQKEAMD